MRKHPAWFDTRRLAFRLYALLGASVALLVILALIGSRVAHRTMTATVTLSQDGLSGLAKSAEMLQLLERHQKLVTAAAIEVAPIHLAAAHQALHDIEVRAFSLVARDEHAGNLQRQLPGQKGRRRAGAAGL
jgi:hypothetical protein